MDEAGTWHGGRPQPRRLCVRWRPSHPAQKVGRAPTTQIYSPCLLWPNCWMDQDATWQEGRPQPRRLCVRWGPSPPPHKGGGAPPEFYAHFYCGQTAGCTKMPLGMEVGLRPGTLCQMGTQPPSQKEGGAPNFRPMSIVSKRLDGSRCHLAWK